MLAAPVADASITVNAFVHFCSGGHQLHFARPAHGQFVVREIRGVTEMRIPAIPRLHHQDSVPGVRDHVSVIVELQAEMLRSGNCLRQDHA